VPPRQSRRQVEVVDVEGDMDVAVEEARQQSFAGAVHPFVTVEVRAHGDDPAVPDEQVARRDTRAREHISTVQDRRRHRGSPLVVISLALANLASQRHAREDAIEPHRVHGVIGTLHSSLRLPAIDARLRKLGPSLPRASSPI
jgi:hypothetical protein